MADLFLYYWGICRRINFVTILRMDYCIFSTLPLNVENTVIHAQSLKAAMFLLLAAFFGQGVDGR